MDLFSSIPQHPLLSTPTELTIRGMMRESRAKFLYCENKIFRSLARLACDKSILLLAHERSILNGIGSSILTHRWKIIGCVFSRSLSFSFSFSFSSHHLLLFIVDVMQENKFKKKKKKKKGNEE